jgi:hypothetical protein
MDVYKIMNLIFFNQAQLPLFPDGITSRPVDSFGLLFYPENRLQAMSS